MPAPNPTFQRLCERTSNLHGAEAAPRITLFDGTADTLAGVKAAGIKAVLVSNKGNAGLVQLLQQLNIINYFNLILSADHVKHHKPSAALYTKHIAPVFPQGDPKNILVVGDTESDLRFANNIGADSCWAAYGYGDASACIALAPTFIISGISELRGLLVC
jgi:phosphoglycolate phosphatase